jgi:hypothetical protein
MRTLAPVVRWLARGLSLVSLGMLLLFMFGEGFNPFRMEPREALLTLFFPIGVMIGLLLGWRFEGMGGAVALVSLLGFYAVHLLLSGRFPGGAWFFVFTSPAVLFVGAELARHRSTAGRAQC